MWSSVKKNVYITIKPIISWRFSSLLLGQVWKKSRWICRLANQFNYKFNTNLQYTQTRFMLFQSKMNLNSFNVINLKTLVLKLNMKVLCLILNEQKMKWILLSFVTQPKIDSYSLLVVPSYHLIFLNRITKS